MTPLVSAIMPTRGRQQWAAGAVEMFRAQDYPNKELVIVDDSMEPSFVRAPEGCVYERAPRLPIGGKRNLACSLASGDIICHWDSDDIYAPDRISHQVGKLIDSNAQMVGYNIMEFVETDGSGKRYEYHGMPGYCIGVSMMYWRDVWEAAPFPNINTDEDNQFFAGKIAVASHAEGRIIARIHGDNTSDKRVELNKAGQRSWRLMV